MIQIAAMLIIMAINTEILPIATIRWIIVVVMILVMNGKKMDIFVRKLPSAASAYPGMDSQRLFAITFQAFLIGLAGPCNDIILLVLA